MILSIQSSIPTFKTLNFKPGLNILLADKHESATGGQTRNSAGKTSFVEIVDFLLGANCPKTSLFRTDALVNAAFIGRFLICGGTVEVERSGSDPSKIYILEGAGRIAAELRTEPNTERAYVQLGEWKRFLGNAMFGLPSQPNRTDFARPASPTFRAMIGYFARKDREGGFLYPERQTETQQRSSWQSCLSYMFGLEWRIAQEFQTVRDREKMLAQLKKAAKGGVIGDVVGTVAELRPIVAIAEERARKKRDEISKFEVLESYRELSEQAASYQQEMQAISRDLVSLMESRKYLEQALEDERPSQSIDLLSMYEASGVELPDVARRRFQDVEEFHASVIQNRRLHLQSEIDETERDIDRANDQLRKASDERKEILVSLQGKGAFEDLVHLQRELAKLEAEHATLKEQFSSAQTLESKGAELRVDRIELQRRLQADHTTHAELLNHIILRIASLITDLYDDRTGRFEVSATENGPEFKIHIEGDRGTGIRSMEIYCMDIVLFEPVHARFDGPGFLIHDSHLFDGVDERQILRSLMIGEASAGTSHQYIITMNSDIYSKLPFPEKYDADTPVLPVRLSDKDETGGLFGFRFD